MLNVRKLGGRGGLDSISALAGESGIKYKVLWLVSRFKSVECKKTRKGESSYSVYALRRRGVE